jgi:hypothetical protein
LSYSFQFQLGTSLPEQTVAFVGAALALGVTFGVQAVASGSGITFEERPRGFKIWYSDRFSNDHQELVEESADWLEDQPGIENLGQIDCKILIADGMLDEGLRNELVAWWTARVKDLDPGVAARQVDAVTTRRPPTPKPDRVYHLNVIDQISWRVRFGGRDPRADLAAVLHSSGDRSLDG